MSNVAFHQCTSRCQSRAARNRRPISYDFRTVNRSIVPLTSLVQFRGEEVAANLAEGSNTEQFIRSNPSVAHAYRKVSLIPSRTVAAVSEVLLTNVTQQSQHSSSLGWSDEILTEFTTGCKVCPNYYDDVFVCSAHSVQPSSDLHH
ncbi:uncharacterized protein PHALS_13933 [Plasmopara halstedii]|uniref:Uncharacterized protein n=1 Tax=Plasmopara halstedii TaxID=4781 RepID=A0A0P1A534_PLAHL|nr:uncharacterized protein PHALS_13933 [Plasmopara halstedii]CEG35181.1 hypothetical protein PHALS_13933 [Plasmopara halstedii]|eukprot:XP_024571550.1 hypothetical protein PHALS_13933 [Plasmopara halstedii]